MVPRYGPATGSTGVRPPMAKPRKQSSSHSVPNAAQLSLSYDPGGLMIDSNGQPTKGDRAKAEFLEHLARTSEKLERPVASGVGES